MKYVKIKSQEIKECTFEWKPCNVLEVIYSYWWEQIRVLFKDIKEEDVDDNIKQGKQKVRDYFDNKE